ncbi:MAG: hypothetical protein IKC87_02610 [Clostridia bacterium]|nr:hypothetical protein [Clostridia bacterium]
MRTFGNILWLPFGLIVATISFLLGVVWCCTLIGIPMGLKLVKLAGLAIWPFGKIVETNFEEHRFLNAVWLTLGGILFAAIEFILGCVFAVTIIGIPFAKQWFKICNFTLAPFGGTVDANY